MENSQAQFELYYPVQNTEISLACPLNDWGKQNDTKYKFSSEKYPLYTLKIDLPHKTPYLFIINGKFLRDPKSYYFDKDLNSVYWDFDDPENYKQLYSRDLSLNDKSTRIMQTYLPGLIANFKDKNGKTGIDVRQSNYYEFIVHSGVIQKIKSLGFNAIQFLPLTKCIDGDSWKFRYLTLYPYSIEDRWGDPNTFAQMIDAFHENKIAVINDMVYSHAPYKDFKINGVPFDTAMLPSHYQDEDTPWGTRRYMYSDPFIRQFLAGSAYDFYRHFHIDGFRIDNVDGILRHGENGDGEERDGGRQFLRELSETIYKANPDAIINYEAHYFSSDNAKMLIASLDSDIRAMGATAYTSSRETYYFQTEYMPKGADKISPSKIKQILDEKEWGQSNRCIADFHNHDAASGLMEGRATGSYAYEAITLKDNYLHFHAIGKIKVMEAIISLCLEGKTLDLLQTVLLQTDSFEKDPNIHWELEEIEANKAVVNFKRKINEIMDKPDFWTKNLSERKVIGVDEIGKTITFQKGKHIIFINMSSEILEKYSIPVVEQKKYKVVFNSDEFKYCGTGTVKYDSDYETKPGMKIKVQKIPPYGILVLR